MNAEFVLKGTTKRGYIVDDRDTERGIHEVKVKIPEIHRSKDEMQGIWCRDGENLLNEVLTPLDKDVKCKDAKKSKTFLRGLVGIFKPLSRGEEVNVTFVGENMDRDGVATRNVHTHKVPNDDGHGLGTKNLQKTPQTDETPANSVHLREAKYEGSLYTKDGLKVLLTEVKKLIFNEDGEWEMCTSVVKDCDIPSK